MSKKASLLAMQPRVINLGLHLFAETLENLGFPVVQVDWRPPAAGDPRLVNLLTRLEHPAGPAPGGGRESPGNGG